MRRKLSRGGMAWRLLVALILALCLVPVGSSPAAALSAEDLFNITYEISLSKTEINGSEIFYATVQGEARCKEDLEFPYNLVSKARITGRVTATHQASGVKVTLNSNYTVTIDPFPSKKDEITQSSVAVSLQFPEGSQSGTYSVAGEPTEAEVKVLTVWVTVTSSLPSSQTIGSITYVAPDGGGGGDGGSGSIPPPAGEEVKTNLFGTEVSFPISSGGEILEEIVATSEDGTLTLTIPEGTIALDKEDNPLTSLEAGVDTSPPPLPENATIIGLAYDFGPDEATFASPITLTRSYDPGDIPEGVAEEDLVLAWYDEAGGKWVELDCIVDTESNTITASIEHFTTFAIIGMVTSAPESEPEVPVAVFRISGLDISPGEVDIGQIVTIHALVWNTTYLEVKTGTYTLVLKINGVVEETRTVEIDNTIKTLGLDAPSPGIWVTFTASKDMAGTCLVDVNGLAGSFVVREAAAAPEPEPTSTPPPISTPPPDEPTNWPVVCGVTAALVAMGSLLFFLARRSHTKSDS